jgi:agmatinase
MERGRRMAKLYQPSWNFLGLPEDRAAPKKARGWVLPVPFEATTCYGANTREGPQAIVAASRQVERFDHDYGCEPALRYGVHTLPPLASVHESPADMVQTIGKAVAGIFSGRPRPEVLCVLGGEHTVSAGVARGLARAFGGKDLVAVQVDAHADLWDAYESGRFSHACAARRILDVCPVFQIGIRNISGVEERFRKGNPRVRTVFSEEANDPRGAFLEDLAAFVRGKTAYLTIDLDGLDPSIMPSVGTPEPDGISWARMLEIARVVAREAKRMPAFDLVELAPIPGLRAPDFLAAKLAFKIFSLCLMKKQAKQPQQARQAK